MKPGKFPAAVAGTLILALMTYGTIRYPDIIDGIPTEIECLFDIKELDNGTYSLLTGYNYQLLKKYADARHIVIKTHICDRTESSLDSLLERKVDIVVLPLGDSAAAKLSLSSCKTDSLSQWVANKNGKRLIADIQSWMEEQSGSEELSKLREPYFTRLNPFRRGSGQSFISPYDDILKTYADSLGLDWKLLAAIAWQESHFRIDAESHRGALGIMQIMPSVAAELQAEDLIDPACGIEAGAKHLKRLYSLFRNVPDEKERIKFTIASYNAGGSRIQSCREYAKSRNMEGNSWNEIVSLIPEIEDFEGTETIAYVDSVLAVHEEICRICR